MTNDYPDSYKVHGESVPPPPVKFRGSLNLRELADQLSPQNAKSVLAFLESKGFMEKLPEDVIQKLILKTCDLPADPPKEQTPVRETSAQSPGVEAGSSGALTPPPSGIFPDGSQYIQNDPDIPF